MFYFNINLSFSDIFFISVNNYFYCFFKGLFFISVNSFIPEFIEIFNIFSFIFYSIYS